MKGAVTYFGRLWLKKKKLAGEISSYIFGLSGFNIGLDKSQRCCAVKSSVEGSPSWLVVLCQAEEVQPVDDQMQVQV